MTNKEFNTLTNNFSLTLLADDNRIGTGQMIANRRGIAREYVEAIAAKMLKESKESDRFARYYFKVIHLGYKQDKKLKFMRVQKFTDVTRFFDL
jgi:hypothetical protein